MQALGSQASQAGREGRGYRQVLWQTPLGSAALFADLSFRAMSELGAEG